MPRGEIRRLDDALKVLALLPPPVRRAVTGMLIGLLLEHSEAIARQMSLPPDHPERYALQHRIYLVACAMVMELTARYSKNGRTALREMENHEEGK